MRIVSGIAKGRKIIPPLSQEVRPTKDRVREAVFNSLTSFDLINGRHFFDLFAGSGALGLEALSRGAAQVTFVDHQKVCIDTIKENIETLGFAELSEVHHGSYLQELQHISKNDVVLLDPPYGFKDWNHIMESITAAAVVIESDHEISLPEPWNTVKVKRYGSTYITIAKQI
ncbi:MAG: 16S rRNA (guanine(966)-N(2))-methyltransferase RsmD [Actinomycetota bacterium]|nr:16S rRNA (guanine(966)-N(2))-methyltransferase RsmD [Actinomycetota bacterium]